MPSSNSKGCNVYSNTGACNCSCHIKKHVETPPRNMEGFIHKYASGEKIKLPHSPFLRTVHPLRLSVDSTENEGRPGSRDTDSPVLGLSGKDRLKSSDICHSSDQNPSHDKKGNIFPGLGERPCLPENSTAKRCSTSDILTHSGQIDLEKSPYLSNHSNKKPSASRDISSSNMKPNAGNLQRDTSPGQVTIDNYDLVSSRIDGESTYLPVESQNSDRFHLPKDTDNTNIAENRDIDKTPSRCIDSPKDRDFNQSHEDSPKLTPQSQDGLLRYRSPYSRTEFLTGTTLDENLNISKASNTQERRARLSRVNSIDSPDNICNSKKQKYLIKSKSIETDSTPTEVKWSDMCDSSPHYRKHSKLSRRRFTIGPGSNDEISQMLKIRPPTKFQYNDAKALQRRRQKCNLLCNCKPTVTPVNDADSCSVSSPLAAKEAPRTGLQFGLASSLFAVPTLISKR